VENLTEESRGKREGNRREEGIDIGGEEKEVSAVSQRLK